MAIKRLSFILTVAVIGILLLVATQIHASYSPTMVNSNYDAYDHDSHEPVEVPKSSDLELPDKVYTFMAPSDTWTFNGTYLEKEYMYYIYIEVVTPHNCSTMRITIWDPDIPPNQKQFNVFESNMFYSPEYGRYFEIPFGAEKSGGYTIEFYSESNDNFNLYIRIEQGPQCLHDKIDSQYHDDEVFFEVTTFDNGKSIDHDIDLETDMSYKFYIGRVSAISIKESNVVRLDYVIEDPEGTDFIIYTNEFLADIDGVTMFNFGTAIEGDYEINIKIYCDVAHVNIAYAVIEDYQISEIEDVNKTKAPEKEDSDKIDIIEELEKSLFSMPVEGLIGVVAFVGGLAGTVYVLMVQQRKKNDPMLKLSGKKR